MAVLRQHCIHTARQDAIQRNRKPVWQYCVRIVSILHGRIAFCRKWLPVIQYCSNTVSILRGRMPVWQYYINIVSILGVRSRITSGWSMLSQYCVRTKLLIGFMPKRGNIQCNLAFLPKLGNQQFCSKRILGSCRISNIFTRVLYYI